MANKQKPPPKGQSKRIQNENSQRNVNIIKHFEPNIHSNTNHLNCDLPEIDVDVDTKETTYKKNTPPIIKVNVNKYQDVPNAREQRNMNVRKIRKHTTKLVSKNKEYMSNSSSSSKNVNATMLKNFTSIKSLMIPTIRSSISSSITTSSRSSTHKENKIQKKKSNINKQGDFNIIDSLRERYGKDKNLSTSIMNRNLVLDLKKEITDNRFRNPLQNPVPSKKNHAINSRSETVDQLRDEIKNIINTNLFDKKEHLAEIRAEISNFRNSGDILVYGVNIDNQVDNNKSNSGDKETVENVSNGRNIEFNNEGTNQCCHQKRCRKTLRYRKSKSKSPRGSNVGTTGLEDDRYLYLQAWRMFGGERATKKKMESSKHDAPSVVY